MDRVAREGTRSRVRRVGSSVAAALLAVLAGSVVGAIPSIGQAGASSGPSATTLTKVNIAPRIPTGATSLGAISASATVKGAVVLEPRDPAALTDFINSVTNKKSSSYHHYLAPGAFGAAFGPTAATLSAVKSQLESTGLSITNVASDNLVVTFKGAASSVESTFHTGLDQYKLADGSTGLATTSAIELPSSIASSVVSVVGLDNLVHDVSADPIVTPKTQAGKHPAASAPHFTHPTGSPDACATASTNDASLAGGLTDDEIANAYGAFGLYAHGDFGKTQTIAVYEEGPFNKTNLTTFDTCYFGATKAAQMAARLHTSYTTGTLRIDGGQLTGTTAESALDVDDVSAIAPTATIDVYSTPNNTFGGLDEYSAIINQDKAHVVTSSWGLCELDVQEGEPGVQQAENVLFEQAAAQGQSIFAAEGDTGSDSCNEYRFATPVTPILSVLDPASDPYVVSVGGTTITDATDPPTEHVWNDGAEWGAGGGGISNTWPMPSWQQDSHVPGINTTTAHDTVTHAEDDMESGFCLTQTKSTITRCRELPDVSAQADEFTGAVTFFTPEFGGWATIGGTSSATPIWAALTALISDSTTATTSVCGGPTGNVGFISPLLYSVASTATAYAASFNDIKAGNNDPYGATHLFPATTGYDMASGLGTPKLTDNTGADVGLAYYLCATPYTSSGRNPRPTVTTIASPVVSTTAATPSVVVHGTGFCTGTTLLVTSLEVGSIDVTSYTATCTATPHAISVDLPPASSLTPADDSTDGAGSYQLTVTLATGVSSEPGPDSYVTYVDTTATTHTTLPTITSVRTYAGPETGGFHVQIYGTGFTAATHVYFGGVTATSFTVKSTHEITAVTPAYSTSTTTCAQSGYAQYTESALTDICQVTVVVKTAAGTSAPQTVHATATKACVGATHKAATILPYYEGILSATETGILTPFPGTEEAPQACEYDYVPRPSITTVSTTFAPAYQASALGGSLVDIYGKGFNDATLDWISVGYTYTTTTTSLDYTVVALTGNEIELYVPGLPQTTWGPYSTTVPFSIRTAAEAPPSHAGRIRYSGFPSTPTEVANESTHTTLTGKSFAPDTGGTQITIVGPGSTDGGYDDAYLVVFTGGVGVLGTQYTLTTTTTFITTTTVSMNPGTVDVLVCTTTTCSTPSSYFTRTTDEFTLFAPGDPVISSVTPNIGLPGTELTITGQNLGCVTGVTFGTTPAITFANLPGFLECGGTTSKITVKAPAHAAGTVDVHVTTVESQAVTYTVTTTQAPVTFTFENAPPPPPTGGGGVTSTGTTTAHPPPKAPTGSTTAKSGSSSTPNGKISVTDSSAGVKATATGQGSLTVAKYTGNPTPTTLETATGKYVDVEVATGSNFKSLTVTVCGATASGLEYWNGSVFLPFSTEHAGATGCVTATVTPTTQPSLTQLTGTIVTAVKAGATATRIAGATADATAVKELETEFPATGKTRSCAGGQKNSANTRPVVLATTKTFPDALAASYLAGSLDTGVLLTPSAALSTVTANALKTEGVTKVIVVGGTLAVSKTVASAIAAMTASACGGSTGTGQKITVTRIGGATALDTAAMIAESVAKTGVGSAAFAGAYSAAYNDTSGSESAAPAGSSPVRTAILADGNEYQDAMAASAMAYAMKFPVLLTSPTSLSSSAATAISQLTISQVIVMGGPYAVSNSVVSALEAKGVSVLRVAGTDATDTAAELAKFEVARSGAGLGWTGRASAAVARANGFTDGLAGSVVTGKTRLPLLLTENQSTLGSYLTAFLKSGGQSGAGIDGLATSKLKALAILGGELAITTTAVAAMVHDIS